MTDHQYAALVRDILEHGDVRVDRTGVGTVSVFGRHLCFDLSTSFPLLTTKRVYWKGVVEELLFFLRGDTDTTILSDANVNIWKGNTSREYLDTHDLETYPTGVAGPIYGYQWRAFNAPYPPGASGMSVEGGVDQIAVLMDQLRHDPASRRHLVMAWNPAQIHEMCLPPCHVMFQMYVTNDHRLSCQMYQRSADVGLGLPFNIASYALLTYLMATTLGYTPGELHLCLGDAHIYTNHIQQLKDQIERDPRPLPTLAIRQRRDRLEEYTADDIVLDGYDPHPSVPMHMAV